jgi:GntR family transcriptional regulator
MARLLLAAEGTPGLEITRHYQDKAKKTFLVTVNVYPADKFKFTFWLHRAETVNI